MIRSHKKSLRIAISCCSEIYGHGIKYIIESNGLDLDTIVICSTTEEIIDAKPDLLIVDFSAFSRISVDTLIKYKVPILIIWSHCLPKFKAESLFNLISKGGGTLASSLGHLQNLLHI